MKIFGGISESRGHHFYSRGLDSNSQVLDLGGHKGEFSDDLVKRFGCTCFVVEAAPELFKIIKETAKVTKYHSAVCDKEGPVLLTLSDNPEANRIDRTEGENTPSGQTIEVEGVTIEGLLDKNNIPVCDLVKMDIEGMEINVLMSVSADILQRIKQVSVEFHDFEDNWVSKEEVTAVKQRMKEHGFSFIRFSAKNNGDVLFIRRDLTGIGGFYFIYLKIVVPIVFGLERLVRRLIG